MGRRAVPPGLLTTHHTQALTSLHANLARQGAKDWGRYPRPLVNGTYIAERNKGSQEDRKKRKEGRKKKGRNKENKKEQS